MEVRMRKTALIALTGALAAMVPGPVAHSRGSHGPKAGKERKAPGKAKPRGRCARLHKKAFVAAGAFVSFTASADTTDSPDAGDLVVDVKHTNRHARSSGGQQTFSTASARVRLVGVTDGNADGVLGLADALAGDRVKLIGKLVGPKRGCTGERTVVVRKVKVKRPSAQATLSGD
jgi:hypothetical protein